MQLKIIKPIDYEKTWENIKSKALENEFIFIKEGPKEKLISKDGLQIFECCKVKHLKDKTIKVTEDD